MKYTPLLALLLLPGCETLSEMVANNPDTIVTGGEAVGGAVANYFGLPAQMGAAVVAGALGWFGIKRKRAKDAAKAEEK